MKKQQLYDALDNLAAQNTSDDIDLAPAIRQQLAERQNTQRSSVLRPRTFSVPYPLRFVAGLLLCFCVAATTVYAVVQLTQEPGLEDEMITPINLSQTVGDFMVTIDYAYADANRIVVGYTVTQDSEAMTTNWFTYQSMSLTDSEGHDYQALGWQVIEQSAPNAWHQDVNFDASIIENGIGSSAPESLDLHLRMKKDFDFDFTVPFTTGIRVEGGAAVEVQDLNARLEWAVITPSMTRVYFCYEMPNGGLFQPQYWAVGQLELDGERVAREHDANSRIVGQLQRAEDGFWCREQGFLTTYRELPKTLTFTILSIGTPTYWSEENMERMAEVYAKYGIEAQVVDNPAMERESYMLTFPSPPEDIDPDLWGQISEEARLHAGEPLEGERIDGPWELTIEVPDES